MTLTTWRKSSFSEHPQGNCVEVAFAPAGAAVRDSKNATGPMMAIKVQSWRAFMGALTR